MTVLWGAGRFLPVIASSIAASASALSPYGLDGSNGKPPRRLDANTNMRMALPGDVSMDVVPLIGQSRQCLAHSTSITAVVPMPTAHGNF